MMPEMKSYDAGKEVAMTPGKVTPVVVVVVVVGNDVKTPENDVKTPGNGVKTPGNDVMTPKNGSGMT